MQLHLNRKIFNGAMYGALISVILIFVPVLHVEFELPKVAIFRICAWIMFLTLGQRWLYEGVIRIPTILKKRSVWLVIVGILMVIGLGVLVSAMPELSFWGNYERFDGGLGYLYVVGFFLLTVLGVEKKEVFERAILLMGWALLIIFVYGVMQKLGLDPFGYNLQEISLGRVFSTMGHPNFLATLVVLVAFPVAVYWQRRSGNMIAGMWILLAVLLIFLTESRAGILGFAAAGITYFLIAGAKTFGKKLFYISVVGVILAAVVVVFVKYSDGWLSSQRSVDYRLLMWEKTIEVIQERPVLGHGIATFGIEFQRNVPKEMVQYEESNVLADKPHNMILEILFESGILGLSIWIFALSLIFREAIKTKKLQVAAIFSSIVGIVVANQFGFSVATHLVILAFLLAYLVQLLSKEVVKVEMIRANEIMKKLLLILISVATLLGIFLHGVLPLLGDYYAEKGLSALSKGEANATVKNLLIAHDLNPKENFYSYLLAEVFIQVEDYDEAQKYLKLAGSFSAFNDGYYFYVKAKLADSLCKKGGMSDCLEADSDYQMALKLYPNYPLFRLSLGLFQAKNGQCKEAITTLESYVSLVSDRFKSSNSEIKRLFEKNNPEFGLAVKYLAKCKMEK